MAFREVVEVLIDVKADQARSAFANLKSEIGNAEGATGKLKAAASGVGTAISNVISSPAGLMGVGTAVTGFAMKAVGDFQELGLAVGKLSESTGLAAEDASRWIEVTGDAGISTEQFTTAVLKLEKGLGTNADAFKKWGVEAVKASDGTVDMNATLIAAFDTLGKIEDPTRRAAAGTAMFGKSWAEMSELVELGADGVTKALNDVSDAKVLTGEDAQSARDLRDAMDELKGVGEDLTITLGKNLAPAIADVVEQITPLLEAVGKLSELKVDGKSILFTGALGWAGTIHDAFSSVEELKGGLDLTATAADATGEAMEASKEDVKRFADANKDLANWVDDSIRALQEQQEQLAAQAEAYTTAADDQIAYNDSVAKFNEVNADSKATMEDVRDSAISSAKAHVALYESLVQTTGAAATATGKIDAQNESLLSTAATAKGPAKQAIVDYIIAVNGIPPDKKTDIIAAIARGDLEEAKRLLDEASEPRDAAIVADANTGAAESELNNTARNRTAMINVGIANAAAIQSWFNRFLVAKPTTAAATTVNITMPRGANGREIDAALARHARVNGRIDSLRRH